MRTSVSAPAGGIRAIPVSSPRLLTHSAFTWLVPDLSFTAATVTLFYSLFFFGGYRAFFHDSDAGWHIRAGEQILRSGTLPRTDPFSFTAAGKPWFAWEWLADLAVGTIHQFWGLSGVALFYGTALAICVWLWFRLHWAAEGSFLLAALFAIPMLSTTNLHWLARPHILSWILVLATVRFCVRPHFSRRSFAAIALVSCVWANVHASFLLGPAVLALYAIGACLGPLLFDVMPRNRQGFAVASLTALAATCLNPYGLALHAHVLRYLTDSALLDRVGEFQSFNFHLAGSAQILLALALAAIGAVTSLSRKDLSAFLLIFVLLALALRSARALPLVALAALPLANGAITQALRGARGLNTSFRKMLDGCLLYSANLRKIDARASGLLWAPLVILIAAATLRVPSIAAATGFPRDEFPVAAYQVIAALPQASRILASDKFGGYLIYRFSGTRPVFFDGRSDLYGAQFLADYGTLSQLRPHWQSILNRHRFTHALLPPDAPLVAALEAEHWKPLYSDAVATLLAAPPERHN